MVMNTHTQTHQTVTPVTQSLIPLFFAFSFSNSLTHLCSLCLFVCVCVSLCTFVKLSIAMGV